MRSVVSTRNGAGRARTAGIPDFLAARLLFSRTEAEARHTIIGNLTPGSGSRGGSGGLRGYLVRYMRWFARRCDERREIRKKETRSWEIRANFTYRRCILSGSSPAQHVVSQGEDPINSSADKALYSE